MVCGRGYPHRTALALLIFAFLHQPLRGEVTAAEHEPGPSEPTPPALNTARAVPDARPKPRFEDQVQQGAVAGQVVNANTGNPVAGARVMIVELQRRTETNENGEYRISEVEPGAYTLRFRALGYKRVQRTVEVERGQLLRADVTLEPQVIRLEELTVTARRRVEVAREVPITETVFGAQEIQDADITRPQDFLDLTPNATMITSQNTGTGAFISLRGIAQQRNMQTSVAVTVDDVLQISPLQFDGAFYDIERIEVIKGPEGALYGRNAIAGAILINTREPTNEFEGFVRMAGGKGNYFRVTAAYGGPIVEDKLLFRVATRFENQDGFYDNLTLNRRADLFNTLGGRAKLKWRVSPRFQVDLKGLIDQSESNPGQWTYQPAILDGQDLAAGNFPFDFDRINSNRVDRNPRDNNQGFGERDMEQVSLRLNYDWDFAHLESITSYDAIRNFQALDQFPYTASRSVTNAFGTIDGTQTQWKTTQGWSEELRLLSPREQRFRWQLGAYYVTWDRFKSTSVGEDRGKGILRLERDPMFSSSTNPTLSWLADDNDNEAWAVFGNAEVDIFNDFTVSGALRYDKELRTQSVSPLSTAGVPGAVNRASFDKLQPKFRIRYTPELQSDVLNFINLYGSWGIGFRSGLFNQNGVAAAAAAAGVQGVEDLITEEEARTFEAGFKTRWFNNRLSVDASFFRTDNEGQPFFLFIGQIGAQVLVNIPDADIKGFESTVRAKLARGLDAYVAVGYIDTEIKEFPVDPTAIGGRLPLVPKSTWNVGAQYDSKVAGDWGIFARVDFERRGEMAWTAVNETPRDALYLLNLKGGVEFGRLAARFEIDNVTDEIYNAEFVKGGFAWPAPPRRWRVILEIGL